MAIQRSSNIDRPSIIDHVGILLLVIIFLLPLPFMLLILPLLLSYGKPSTGLAYIRWAWHVAERELRQSHHELKAVQAFLSDGFLRIPVGPDPSPQWPLGGFPVAASSLPARLGGGGNYQAKLVALDVPCEPHTPEPPPLSKAAPKRRKPAPPAVPPPGHLADPTTPPPPVHKTMPEAILMMCLKPFGTLSGKILCTHRSMCVHLSRMGERGVASRGAAAGGSGFGSVLGSVLFGSPSTCAG